MDGLSRQCSWGLGPRPGCQDDPGVASGSGHGRPGIRTSLATPRRWLRRQLVWPIIPTTTVGFDLGLERTDNDRVYRNPSREGRGAPPLRGGRGPDAGLAPAAAA